MEGVFIGTDGNFAGFARAAGGCRFRLPHRYHRWDWACPGAGLGVHIDKVAEGQHGFRLSKGLLDIQACRLAELLKHLRIQRLACGCHIFQMGEIVFGKVLLDEIAIDGGRCAEGCDLKFADYLQKLGGTNLSKS